MRQKKLKDLKKRCPECEEGGLILINRSIESNGVIYWEKSMYCPVCEYRFKIKEKNNWKKQDIFAGKIKEGYCD